MISQSNVESAIQDIAQPYSDGRTQLFSIEVDTLSGSNLRLRGRVLEPDNHRALLEELSARFPELSVDASAVEVVRRPQAKILSVSTNLTSLHNGTSFLAEMATQMLNGAKLEILWEQDRWAFVRLDDGYLGWTYLPYLAETPAPQPATHIVSAPVTMLRESPHAGAPLVTRLLGGTYVFAASVQSDWVWVKLAGELAGWLPVSDLRSLERLPQDASARQVQMERDAFQMIGVPYLWGGCTANGIDCSGFAQLLHRWIGVTLPRDADLQCDAGKPVEPPFQPGDLLFFGEAGENRRITHVGVSLGGWRMIHSSRRRNGVQVDDVQQVESLKSIFLCAATYINR